MTSKLLTSALALSTAFATPAFADVTAADVFSNQQAMLSAMGVTLSGEVSDGRLANPELNVILPMGLANMQITADDIMMTENGDGSVTISYPSPMTISVTGGAQDAGDFSATMVMTHDDYTIEASGTPGDISYATTSTNLRLEFADLTVDAMEGGEEMEMTGFLTVDDYSGTSRVTEGNLINVTYNTETGLSEADFTVTIGDIVSTSSQVTQPVSANLTASLPVGGSDLMNLSAALRNGLSFALDSTGAGSSSESSTMLGGELMNRQDTSTGNQVFSMVFDEDGFKATGEAADFTMLMNDPLVFPADLEFGIAGLSINYDVPVNASEDPQDFRVATALNQLTVDDTLWNLFDPGQVLPRDPADISFDITGIGTNGMDLLDIAAMSQMFGPPPIQIDEFTIEDLRIAAAGAEAMAKGSMTLDWTDFNTIPGMPRPEGAVTINLNGANQLMDRLSQMGLISAEELMMPRMMMGMFATPVGEDMLESVIEVNEQGHVLANGQRLQ